MKRDSYDFIITGAGPVGLAAAITAGRLGSSCIVLEKGDRPGPEPRGESIAPYPFMDELLGTDWLKTTPQMIRPTEGITAPWTEKADLLMFINPTTFFIGIS